MRFLYKRRFWPNIYVSKNPFKIYEYNRMIHLAHPNTSDVVLDFGCGNGLQACLLAKKSRKVIGIDICNLAKAEAKKQVMNVRYQVEFIQSRLERAHFSKGLFDKIFGFCVLEHLSEYRETLMLFHKFLKDGGELILSVDSLESIPSDLKAKHAREHSVKHYFQREEIQTLLHQFCYKDVHIEPMICSHAGYRMFRQGIQNGFNYGIGESMWKWLLLNISENLNGKREKGIFLTVHCRK
jgi:ubiquinone/menaquinone biosynthesis C-methylase UbiE